MSGSWNIGSAFSVSVFAFFQGFSLSFPFSPQKQTSQRSLHVNGESSLQFLFFCDLTLNFSCSGSLKPVRSLLSADSSHPVLLGLRVFLGCGIFHAKTAKFQENRENCWSSFKCPPGKIHKILDHIQFSFLFLWSDLHHFLYAFDNFAVLHIVI